MFVHAYLYVYFILFLVLIFNLSLMRRNFNLAKPQGTFLPDPNCTSFYVSHPVLCSTRLCPCFYEFQSFFRLNQFTPILYFCRQSHLPSADAFFFLRFYEFFRDFTRFQIFFVFIFKFKGEEPYLCFMEPKYMF